MEAVLECGGHLEMEWTDDPVERIEGDKLVLEFVRRADLLRNQIKNERSKPGINTHPQCHPAVL